MVHSPGSSSSNSPGSAPGVKPVIRVGECLQILEFLARRLDTSVDLANVSDPDRSSTSFAYRIPEFESMVEVLRKI